MSEIIHEIIINLSVYWSLLIFERRMAKVHLV